MSGAPRQPWKITSEAFECLLAQIHPDREIAAQRFASLHAKLVLFFTYNRCSQAEALADETLDRVARRIAEGQPVPDVNAFAHGVAKLVLLESHRQQRRERDLQSASRDFAPPGHDEQSLRCLENCLHRLSYRTRSLIVRYYSKTDANDRVRLASELGISLDALRTRVLRARRELEHCVTKCRENAAEMS